MVICPEFSSGAGDAAICTCKQHWNYHSPAAKTAFFRNATPSAQSHLVDACKRDNEFPCKQYQPAHDWEAGTRAPECVCGRPSVYSHPAQSVLEGIRKYRAQHGTKTRQEPCGHFYGTVTMPGTCSVCNNKWIDHPHKPLVIEGFYDLHEDWCKCIIMNGDVECSCMTHIEIQEHLDRIGGAKPAPKKEPANVACKQFKSKSQGHTHCGHCGEAFHQHSKIACDGFVSYIQWRAAHMGNKELLEWFQALPGKDRQERIKFLTTLLADPYKKYVPPSNQVNPNTLTMAALVDALTHSHNVRRDVIEVEATVVHEEDLPLNQVAADLHWCYSCGEHTATVQGMMCKDCIDYLDNMAGQPVNSRVSNDKGGS